MGAILGTIALQAASAALPYAVDWAKKSIYTWGPAKAANSIVDRADRTGRDMLGGKGVFGAIGGFIGRAGGTLVAPFIVQSQPSQAALEVASTLAGVAIGAIGNAVINRFTGPAVPAETARSIDSKGNPAEWSFEKQMAYKNAEIQRMQLEVELMKAKKNLDNAPKPVEDTVDVSDWVMVPAAA